MNKKELDKTLKLHEKWLEDSSKGGRANLWRADLRGADLYGADLKGANLREADLREANLRGANLKGADLREAADLYGANLREANLREANLKGANLKGANLREANLWGADLWRADLRGADLRGANLRADLYGANLREANLREANLKGANLKGANLREANLWGADLKGANLREADLREADLRGAVNLPKVHYSLLSILKHQKNKMTAFKYLNQNMTSPYQDFKYKIGETYSTDSFEEDERILCGNGFNVATLNWCLLNTYQDLTKCYIEVEFDPNDIIAIPFHTDGKFRVKKLTVVRKLTKKELEKAISHQFPSDEKQEKQQ
jgi:uncharacterized protein YjbI with pentapeptide repeats